MKKNQKGFSVVEFLLILVIIGMLGFVGWYVWNSNNKTNKLLQNSSDTSTNALVVTKKKSSSSTAVDPTANWIAYSSKDGQYSLKYPTNWVVAPKPSAGCGIGDSFLLMGGNSMSTGKYCPVSAGQIIVRPSDVTSDDISSEELPSDVYTNVVKTNVTVNGVKGEKMSGINNGKEIGADTLPAGTKEVVYIFTTGGRAYVADYVQTSSYPDVLSDFNLMVTKTLQFHS